MKDEFNYLCCFKPEEWYKKQWHIDMNFKRFSMSRVYMKGLTEMFQDSWVDTMAADGQEPIYQYSLNLIPACIINYIRYFNSNIYYLFILKP